MERVDYIRELQRIALGRDPTAGPREKLAALGVLLELDRRGASNAAAPLDDMNAAIESLLEELVDLRLGEKRSPESERDDG